MITETGWLRTYNRGAGWDYWQQRGWLRGLITERGWLRRTDLQVMALGEQVIALVPSPVERQLRGVQLLDQTLNLLWCVVLAVHQVHAMLPDIGKVWLASLDLCLTTTTQQFMSFSMLTIHFNTTVHGYFVPTVGTPLFYSKHKHPAALKHPWDNDIIRWPYIHHMQMTLHLSHENDLTPVTLKWP